MLCSVNLRIASASVVLVAQPNVLSHLYLRVSYIANKLLFDELASHRRSKHAP